MASPLDKFRPRTRFRFPDGANFCVGTTTCDDRIHQAVYLSYTPSGSTTPSLELELPPKTVEVLVRHLQERANEARFVNGETMLDTLNRTRSSVFVQRGERPGTNRGRKRLTRKRVERSSARSVIIVS